MSDDDNGFLRKVYFFRLAHFSEIKNDLPLAMKRIENLPSSDAGRYQIDDTTNSRLIAFPDHLEYPLRLRFGRTRRDRLPDIEFAGKIKNLNLKEDEGLIDVCHIVIFEDGYAASEFNYDGPRMERLGSYLWDKGGGLKNRPRFLPLFERDIVEVIRSLNNVRAIELEVPPDSIALIREADDNLATAVEASARAGASKKVGIYLNSDTSGSRLHSLAERLAVIIKSRPLERKRINRLKVTGSSGVYDGLKYVDILEEKLVSSEIFPRSKLRSRSVNSDAAYDLIEQAYIRRKHVLNMSASIANL